MKRLLLLLTISLFTFLSQAQVQEYWAATETQTGMWNDYCYFATPDGLGNMYAVGYVYVSATVTDAYVAKYDANGQQLWMNTWDGYGQIDLAYVCRVDGAGNLVVCGRAYNGTDNEAFLLKYDHLGTLLWDELYNGTGTGDERFYDIVIDASNNIYACGISAATGNSTFANVNKYDSNGNAGWIYTHDNGGAESFNSIGIKGTSVYATGGETNSSSGYLDVIVKKMNMSDGVETWSDVYNVPNTEQMGFGVEFDDAGNLYIGSQETQGSYEGVIRKYTSADALDWTTGIFGSPNAFVVDGNGTVYAGGSSGGNDPYGYLIAITSAGAPMWTKIYDELNSAEFFNGMELDDAGNLYVVARTDKTGVGDSRLFKYTPGGVEEYAFFRKPSLSAQDWPGLIIVEDEDVFYLTGQTYAGTNGGDAMLAKFCMASTGTITSADGLDLCDGESLTLDASANTYDFIQWYLDDVAIAGATSATYDATAGGDYYAKMGDGCLILSNTLTINQIQPTPASAGPDEEVCSGAETVLDGQGGLTFLWSNGSTDEDPTVYPTSNQEYTVTVTDEYGCTGIASVSITTRVAPLVDAGGDYAVCEGESVQIGGLPVATGGTGGGYSYAWDNAGSLNSSTTSNPMATPTATTTYEVCVTDDGNGCVICDDMLIMVSFAQAPTALYTSSSNGLDVTFNNGSLNANAFAWTFGDGGSSSAINPTHTYASTGTYAVKLIVSNDCGGSQQIDELTQNVTITQTMIEQQALLVADEFSLYPNPTANIVFIENSTSDTQNSLEVLNSLGQVMEIASFQKDGTTLNVSDWAKGIYFVRLSNSNGVVAKRLVVE